jgi:hypothetical protein
MIIQTSTITSFHDLSKLEISRQIFKRLHVAQEMQEIFHKHVLTLQNHFNILCDHIRVKYTINITTDLNLLFHR